MSRFLILTYFIFQVLFANNFSAQTYTQSQKTTVINGKKYYLHKVEKGQSLYGIAKLYNVDLNMLIMENPGAIDGIKHGQELKVPAEKPTQQVTPADLEKYVIHNVAKGETVFSICQKYQITEQQLSQLNPDIKNGLKEGLVLKIKEKPTATVITNTVPVTTTNTVSPVDTTTIIADKPKKTAYTVGVFLPFSFTETDALNIDELIINKQNFPNAQQVAIDFYEGLQKAADSLKSNDFAINFKIYDVSEKDSLLVSKYAREESFKKLDLIIGPMYNSSFKIISTEAKKLQIPCVSPLTQQNKVLFENVFTSKTTPSNNTLLGGLAAFCIDSFITRNLVLINTGYSKDQASIKYFKQIFNEKAAAKNLKDTMPEVKGINGAKALYRADKLNYFIVLSENETPISDFITHLNMFADKKENIRVIGLKKWISLDNLDLEYFNRFTLTFPTSYFIDYDNPFIKKLSRVYRDKYYSDAGDYYYYAADAGLYYFELLKMQGPAFCTILNKFPKKGTLVNFDFFHPNNQTGFENQAVQIIRYTDYKLKKVN
ncbi:MAG TPA: LysM peptidoglycan-binding domain-containing protein [Bacteroidia bacterium]|jgi:LysM repeat protein|nr:LysM peptidoglycan-binding domain-containing protein [Bacteroidia bacterium]